MKYIKDFDVKDKRVLVRCDFNTPIDDAGNILDDFRIKKTLPTINYLLENKAKVILMTHLGEPEGQVIDILKLDKVRQRLEQLVGVSVVKTDDCIGSKVQEQVFKLKAGHILLLENVRFHKEETDNNVEFAQQLAQLGEIYVNDAFGDCHRAHASMVSVPQFLPNAAGLLLQSEMENLDKVLKNPAHPVTVLIGGIKVGTKSKFIENISEIADDILVSGLIKKEISEKNLTFKFPEKIIGPADNLEALDIDENAITIFTEKIMAAKTIVWNGPFGKFEDENYKHGTLEIAKAIVKSGAFSVAGGGETIEFLRKEDMLDKFNHVSTGGGAMLDYLSGEELPGIKALN